MKRILSLITLMLLPMGLLLAQGSHLVASQSILTIDGTSSLHDWQMTAESIKGSATLEVQDNKIAKISQLKLLIPSKSLKSGKKGMDSNAYEALKAEHHPNIIFELPDSRSFSTQGGAARLSTDGKLTIAGKTRTEKMEVDYQVDAKGAIHIKGKKVIRMSDYQVEAPSFMFGKFTTGNELTISFTLVLTPNPLYTQN